MEFNWFESQLISDSIVLNFNGFEVQVIWDSAALRFQISLVWDSSDLVVNWFPLFWKSIDLRFNGFRIQLLRKSIESIDLRFKCFEIQVICGSTALRFKCFEIQVICDSSDLVVNWSELQVIWLSTDLRFHWFQIQLDWAAVDLRFKRVGIHMRWDSNDFGHSTDLASEASDIDFTKPEIPAPATRKPSFRTLFKSTTPANVFATLTNSCACYVFCNVSKSLRLLRKKHFEPPKTFRDRQFLRILTSKSLSRHNVVQILRSSTSKSDPNMPVFNDFDFRIALAPPRGAKSAELNFQKCSETVSF